MKFEIFFFKQNTREYDVDELINFVLTDRNMSLINEDDKVILKYSNDLISLDYNLCFTRASRVPDIARLNPMYLDLDFYVEYDLVLPIFKLNMISNLIESLCSRYGFSIYNYLFDDVSPFSRELIAKSYTKVREVYKEKFLSEYKALNYVLKDKLEGYYKYILEAKTMRESLNNEYLFSDTYFVKNALTDKANLVAELNLDAACVIPPFVDLIVLEKNGEKQKYSYLKFLELTEKYLLDFPGFIGNAKMINNKNLKKIKKIVAKMKLQPVLDSTITIKDESLIDF